MSEEPANNDADRHKQRAAKARRRADEARQRVLELRQRRQGAETPAAKHHEDLQSAMARAQEAHDHLILALEGSAVAHELASARYFQQAKGDPDLEAKARFHLAAAEADRQQAIRLNNS